MKYTHWALKLSGYGDNSSCLAKAHLFYPEMKGSKNNSVELYHTRQDARDAKDWLIFALSGVSIEVVKLKVSMFVSILPRNSQKVKA